MQQPASKFNDLSAAVEIKFISPLPPLQVPQANAAADNPDSFTAVLKLPPLPDFGTTQ